MATFLSQVILDVQDIRRSLEFYHGVLSLPVRQEDSFEGHHLAYLRTGGSELLLIQQPSDEQGELLERCGGLVINFEVDDLGALLPTVQSHEIEVLRGVEDAGCGERTMLIADPDGYAILLSETIESKS